MESYKDKRKSEKDVKESKKSNPENGKKKLHLDTLDLRKLLFSLAQGEARDGINILAFFPLGAIDPLYD